MIKPSVPIRVLRITPILLLVVFASLAARADVSWTRIFSTASQDIGVGPYGTVFHIAAADGNGSIFRWAGTPWVRQPGGGNQVSVDAQGLPWVVNADGVIFAGVPDPLRGDCPNPHPLWGSSGGPESRKHGLFRSGHRHNLPVLLR